MHLIELNWTLTNAENEPHVIIFLILILVKLIYFFFIVHFQDW